MTKESKLRNKFIKLVSSKLLPMALAAFGGALLLALFKREAYLFRQASIVSAIQADQERQTRQLKKMTTLLVDLAQKTGHPLNADKLDALYSEANETAAPVPTSMVADVAELFSDFIETFTGLIRKSAEGASKGNLGAIRSALAIYYGDMEGAYPSDLASLTVGGRYLSALPVAKIAPSRPDSSAVHTYDATVCKGDEVDPAKLQDTGGWGYVADPKASCYGTVFINSTQKDPRGQQWALY